VLLAGCAYAPVCTKSWNCTSCSVLPAPCLRVQATLTFRLACCPPPLSPPPPPRLFHGELGRTLQNPFSGLSTCRKAHSWQGSSSHCWLAAAHPSQHFLKGSKWCLLPLQVFKVVKAEKEVSNDFYFKKIMPVGFFMACTLYFGNLVYLYLTVGSQGLAPSTI
jgi:hypothetical protein